MAKELLANIYLFKGLRNEDLHQLEQIAKTEKVGNGEVIFSEGQPAHALYVIRYGTVEIHHSASTGDDVRVATLGTGDFFGEMSLINAQPRTGTATAHEVCELVRIDYDKLKAVFELQTRIAAHFYKQFAHFLAARLLETTEDLSFAREKARARA